MSLNLLPSQNGFSTRSRITARSSAHQECTYICCVQRAWSACVIVISKHFQRTYTACCVNAMSPRCLPPLSTNRSIDRSVHIRVMIYISLHSAQQCRQSPRSGVGLEENSLLGICLILRAKPDNNTEHEKNIYMVYGK